MPYLVFRGTRIPLDGYSPKPVGRGYVYCCATCGENWGTLHTEGVGHYIITAMPCPEHGKTAPTHQVGGSFRYPFRWRDNYVPAEGVPLSLIHI